MGRSPTKTATSPEAASPSKRCSPESSRSIENPRRGSIETIRFVGPAEAVENGVTTILHDDKTPAEKNRYRAVHVKRDGKWLMASAADLPRRLDRRRPTQTTRRADRQLDRQDPETLVLTSYRWTDNRRFILGQFTVQVAGKPAMTGTQRIGWDPLRKVIRSWVFDSEGGFAEGTWEHVFAIHLRGMVIKTPNNPPNAETTASVRLAENPRLRLSTNGW